MKKIKKFTHKKIRITPTPTSAPQKIAEDEVKKILCFLSSNII